MLKVNGMLNIDSSRGKNAQARDEAIFHDLSIYWISWTRFESSVKNPVFALAIWAVELESDWFSGSIMNVHEMLTKDVC